MNREFSHGLLVAGAGAAVLLLAAPSADALAGGPGAVSVFARLLFGRLCHQDPARSLFIAGALLPVCARCTGIYLGFLLGCLGRYLLPEARRDSFLTALPLLLGTAPLVIDGVLNASGAVSSPAAVRAATGVLFGITAARALWPAVLAILEKLEPRRARRAPAGA